MLIAAGSQVGGEYWGLPAKFRLDKNSSGLQPKVCLRTYLLKLELSCLGSTSGHGVGQTSERAAPLGKTTSC